MINIETINKLSGLVRERDTIQRALKTLKEIEVDPKVYAQHVDTSIWTEDCDDFSGRTRSLVTFGVDDFKGLLELSLKIVEGKLMAQGVDV